MERSNGTKAFDSNKYKKNTTQICLHQYFVIDQNNTLEYMEYCTDIIRASVGEDMTSALCERLL